MTTILTRRLYLDCDGVLADFDRHFLAEFGAPPRTYDEIHGERVFWQSLEQLEPPFFRSLPLMPDARALFDAVAPLRPIILTGCPRGGWAELQKLAWATEYFPGTPMIVTMARDKALYCQPGDVLVDDRDKYRDRWEAAGGIFVHHTDAVSTIAALAKLGLLSDHCGECGAGRYQQGACLNCFAGADVAPVAAFAPITGTILDRDLEKEQDGTTLGLLPVYTKPSRYAAREHTVVVLPTATFEAMREGGDTAIVDALIARRLTLDAMGTSHEYWNVLGLSGDRWNIGPADLRRVCLEVIAADQKQSGRAVPRSVFAAPDPEPSRAPESRT